MSQDVRTLRYLFVHTGWSEQAVAWHEEIVARHRARGYDVRNFLAVSNGPGPHFTFRELDARWRRQERSVRRLRDRFVEAASDCDVVVNFNGANIHPAWLEGLKAFSVYLCFDDPESSGDLSAPVARYFDFAFTGNAACVPLYQSWGIRRCDYLPIGVMSRDRDTTITLEQIGSGERDIDVVFFGERVSSHRRDRLDRLRQAFPRAVMHGRGWESGFLSESEKLASYRRAKIGWNVHNSVGPVNLRTFALPANGVMQICDNRCRLGSIFKLGEEVVGFDTVEECIDLTQYYLAHDEERAAIATAGFERVLRDYTEERIWERLLETIQPYIAAKRDGTLDTPTWRREGRSATSLAKRGLQAGLRRTLGLELRTVRTPERVTVVGTRRVLPYQENPEVGPVNLAAKNSRVEEGGWFEWPNMVALNWAVASLVGTSKSIVELGGGTGAFAFEAAADPTRKIVCSDLDGDAISWAKENRQRPNICYLDRVVTLDDGPFDLAVAVDVIEHVADFRSFLVTMASLAPRALLSTPNKNRDEESSRVSPPAYEQHVREWTAGEFYWVLQAFFGEVRLYGMVDVHVPAVVPISVTDQRTPVIADCSRPLVPSSGRETA